MKKYRFRKQNYASWTVILIFLLVALIFVNIGYSLWSTKLDVFGNVRLELNIPNLEITIPITEGERRVNLYDSDGFLFVKDEYSENSLITTLKIMESDNSIQNLRLSFSMKNMSQNDELYVDGKVKLVEQSNISNVASDVYAYLSKGIIETGNADVFNFSADINKEMMDSNIYYKYEISYNIDGVNKNFFYIVNILKN